MRNICRVMFLTIVVLIFWSSIASAQMNGWSGNIHLSIGVKSLEKYEWAPVDKHNGGGIEINFKKQQWPASIAIGFLVSTDEEYAQGIKFEGETLELVIGGRKIWNIPFRTHLFIGAGLSYVTATFKGSSIWPKAFISDSDSVIGGWLDTGVYWGLTGDLDMGIKLVYSKAEVTLFDISGDAGGLYYGFLVGYPW